MPTTLVTGATAGLGLSAAHQLVSKGHHVLVHGRSQAKVDDVVKSLEKKGGTASGYIADLSLMADVRRLGEEVSKDYPALDGLLNNAGSFDGDCKHTGPFFACAARLASLYSHLASVRARQTRASVLRQQTATSTPSQSTSSLPSSSPPSSYLPSKPAAMVVSLSPPRSLWAPKVL